jgi:hypothetical protein
MPFRFGRASHQTAPPATTGFQNEELELLSATLPPPSPCSSSNRTSVESGPGSGLEGYEEDSCTVAVQHNPESEPLITPQGASSSSASSFIPSALSRRRDTQRFGRYTIEAESSFSRTSFRQAPTPQFAESDDDYVVKFVEAIMEKLKDSKAKRWADRLAVESEPGLTTAQLMLFNHDLKPVEPERRQWGPWNFVGFWVGKLYTNLTNRAQC